MAVDIRNSDAVLSVDEIRSRVSDLEIFRYYCQSMQKIGVKFSSEFREDPVPSAVISFWKGKFKYMDFGYPEHSFDSIGYVMYKYSLTFIEALNRIDVDLGLGLGTGKATFSPRPYVEADVRPKIPSVIRVRSRDLNFLDRVFWEQFQISVQTLKRFNVIAITHYWINDIRFQASKVCYAYVHLNGKYKIYSPLALAYKWQGNVGEGDIQGFEMLPSMGEEVLLVSSLKDVMCLFELGIPAIALQNEGVMPKKELIELLSKRFNRIRVLYDNDYTNKDNPGQRVALRICEEYGLENICIPSLYEAKDPSDLMFAHGPIPLFKLIRQ